MPIDFPLSDSMLFGFLFTLARVSSAIAFLPLAATRAASDSSKVVLSLAVTLILWPKWSSPSLNGGMTTGRLVAGLVCEIVLGLAIGLTIAIILELFQVAAQIVSVQAGFGFASTVDPTSGADSTVLITLAQITAALLFFAGGGDRMFIRVLADSIRLCPPDSLVVRANWAEMMSRFFGTVFSSGLRLAAPVVALLLLADLSLAVLGRLQQQLHLVSLTMPLKLGVTMLVLSATLSMQPGYLESAMSSGVRLLETILRSAH